jgi:acetylornithine deacetylase/succinyl-diaminopimelate desuccinylase-like protein
MSDLCTRALAYARDSQARFLDSYKTFLAIPSVSTDPIHAADVQRAAAWVAEQLVGLGADHVQIIPTRKHPVVYGDILNAGPDAPTVLVYGHYDVQPVDPLELWESEPFTPVERDGYIHARGASDMKGQVTATFNAIEALQRSGGMPLNVKFMLEGEEEIGSPNMESFLAEHQALLASDFSLNPDAGGLVDNIPTIGYALRGLCYFELRVYGPSRDLHSGSYGGVIHNPAQVLCELIAGMHDAAGRVTLPGFYDPVRPLDAAEREDLARLPYTDAFFQQQAGVSQLWGEAGYNAVERIGARPTLEVNGLLSGFTGQGSKTVLPAWAMAKISMRLVADQRPADVQQQFIRYLETHAPPTVRWEIEDLSSGDPVITDRNMPEVQALYRALAEVWGVEPIFVRGGGSVPVVAQLRQYLGIDSLLTGFAQPGDRIHSPNERMHLPTWYRGIEALIHFFTGVVAVE